LAAKPSLKKEAVDDPDLARLTNLPEFITLVTSGEEPSSTK
jgi:hypothetical protein